MPNTSVFASAFGISGTQSHLPPETLPARGQSPLQSRLCSLTLLRSLPARHQIHRVLEVEEHPH